MVQVIRPNFVHTSVRLPPLTQELSTYTSVMGAQITSRNDTSGYDLERLGFLFLFLFLFVYSAYSGGWNERNSIRLGGSI